MLAALPPRERQIVDILYQRGAATVSEVGDALANEVTGSAIRAMLKRLEDKGFVERESSERGFVYAPRVSEKAARKSALSQIVKTFFNGAAAGAPTALIGMEDKLADDELDELEQLIAKAREGRKA